jgi:hypothetical protein
MQFCCAISPSCDSMYMNCLSAYAKAASVSRWLLDFWFVTLMDLWSLDQKVSSSPSTIWLAKMSSRGA